MGTVYILWLERHLKFLTFFGFFGFFVYVLEKRDFLVREPEKSLKIAFSAIYFGLF